MNILLLFFALPVATVILSAILETILHSPLKVTGIVFSIYLIVTFAAFDTDFLVFLIVYTILAYITAWLVRAWCERENNFQTLEDLITEANNANNNNSNNNNNNNSGCGCNRGRRW